MNALELADELESIQSSISPLEIWQAVAMLRKQAEEIEYWKSAFERAMEIKK